jgi:hypothetical protein
MPCPASRKKRLLLPLLVLPALLLFGCDRDQGPEPAPAQEAAVRLPGCQGCHPEVRLDAAHALPCVSCHLGDGEAAGQEEAHAGLRGRPAHPAHMAESCGPCHAGQVTGAADSLHFTLKNEVNLVRAAFGAGSPLTSLTEIPLAAAPATPLELADDLLRRRCLSCHVYSRGDTYAETVRGTGCAACHLEFAGGRMQGHAFVRSPADNQCLHCHYGNRVGADYHGRHEHDFNWEYRTPYRTDSRDPRPYGVEYHQLVPDIHQQAGLACIDCHSGSRLMAGHSGRKEAVTCLTCHAPGARPALPGLRRQGDRLVLTTRLSGQELSVPPLRHPAHKKHGDRVHCSVCHSQWSFNDQGLHLIRYDEMDPDPWDLLTVQGSFEAEWQLEAGIAQPRMRDKISGESRPGLWLLGYEQRRWEDLPVGLGPDNRLHVLRPVLDLHLSFVDGEGQVRFAGVGPREKGQRFRAYTPHTTGKAGAFYQERLKAREPLEDTP